MSAYDDMCVLANSSLVAHVCSTKVSTTSSSNKNTKAFLWKSLDWARVCFLVLLIASPVSTSPVRSRRAPSSHSSIHSSQPLYSKNYNSIVSNDIISNRLIAEDSIDLRLLPDDVETAQIALENKIAQQLQRAVERSPLKVLRSIQEQQLSPAFVTIEAESSSSNSNTERSSSTLLELERQAISAEILDNLVRMADETDNASSRSRRDAHWSQPCNNLMYDSENTPQSLSDVILKAVARAHTFMIDFKEKYANGTLKMDWNILEFNFTKDHTIKFLKEIDNSTQMEFNIQLQEAYEMMQRLAVGIEQVTLDQALYTGKFLDDFRVIESQIVMILCQLHYAMVHQKLQAKVVVTKEIMEESYRDLEGEMARNMRDATIVREYDRALKHLIDIFTHFKQEA